MSVQWFPGHMHLTRQALVDRLKATDVVIELLDARLPGSSANPLLAALAGHKPGLKLLNKTDLADEARTQAWLDWYNAQEGIRAIPMQAVRAAPAQQLIAASRTLAPLRKGVARPMRVLVCGVPNVGKSTLINSLAGKRRAATGDEAGITRQEQRIVLEDDFYLYDTPGLLWPRIAAPQVGFNLAASGAVGRNAFDDVEVALELLERLNPHYLDALNARYKIRCDAAQPADVLLEAIGRSRGAVGSGGRVHMEKAAGIVIHDFRSGAIGRITLETPPQYMQWTAQAQERDAARQQEREQRQSSRTARRKKR